MELFGDRNIPTEDNKWNKVSTDYVNAVERFFLNL